MRLLVRWFVVIAVFCAVLLAGAAPVFESASDSGSRSSVSVSTAPGVVSTSGFESLPAPEKPVYIGPGVAIPGSTVINAFVPSVVLAAWRLPSRATAASSPALHVSRVSPHLRSIQLLI